MNAHHRVGLTFSPLNQFSARRWFGRSAGVPGKRSSRKGGPFFRYWRAAGRRVAGVVRAPRRERGAVGEGDHQADEFQRAVDALHCLPQLRRRHECHGRRAASPSAAVSKRAGTPGSGTTSPREEKLPGLPVAGAKATPSPKVTVAPGPMFSAASVWLTLISTVAFAFRVDPPAPSALVRIVVPPFALSVA